MNRLIISCLVFALVASCDDDDDDDGATPVVDGGIPGDGNGDGDGTGDADDDGDGGNGGDADDDGCDTTLIATVRDFPEEHPDFENDDFMNESSSRDDMPLLGIVEEQLGDDSKPVYTTTGEGKQTTSKADFDQWYRDVAGENESFRYEIELTPQDGSDLFVYDNQFFFPIDDKGFGNEGNVDDNGDSRNFFFTTEIHTEFEYKGGEVFTFIGDDDLWLFINGKLAIDIGGLHPKKTGTVNLNESADQLGITVGNRYTMDIFHAERHTTASTFRIETTIGCIISIPL